MEGPHLGEVWHDLYVMLGTSSAALLGLLFVAASLHLDEITKNFSYRARGLNNSYMLIFTLVEATIILTPQPVALLSGIAHCRQSRHHVDPRQEYIPLRLQKSGRRPPRRLGDLARGLIFARADGWHRRRGAHARYR